ncbi:dihydroxyacetone kinase Dak1 [Exophiala oligosperma]
MTSLNSPGFSISLLNVRDLGVQGSVLNFLDAASDVPGWHATSWPTSNITPKSFRQTPKDVHQSQSQLETSQVHLKCELDVVVKRLKAGLQSMIASEPDVIENDNLVGDGDCGTTLKRGAEGIFGLITETKITAIVSLLDQSTSIVERTMDGTSGALYSIFLNALTWFIKKHQSQEDNANVAFWSRALASAMNSLEKYTPARKGDRTLMDSLIPFVNILKATEELNQAAEAAMNGAEKTKWLHAKLGRTVYIGEEEKWLGKIPDPGAWGLASFLVGFSRGW